MAEGLGGRQVAALKAAGWGVVEGSRVLREHGITLGRLQGSGGKGARAKAEIAAAKAFGHRARR
jgi:hypothetical protein